MKHKDLELYQKQGYVIVDEFFDNNEVTLLNEHTCALMACDIEGKVLEDNGQSVRSINGPHFHSELFRNLASDGRLLRHAKAILGGEVYVHQYKINTKQAFNGQSWEWHSDYWFWKKEDGMPEAKAFTAVIFLDDVNEFNGPMLLVPETQHDELIDEVHSRPYGDLDGGDNWAITTSKDLKYRLSDAYLRKKIETKGIVSAKGQRGSVLFFHSNLLHCSSANSSPWDRKGIFISYSLVSNALHEVPSPRPEFMASRDFTALTEVSAF
ncbi:phytanoyl-CoA dioxygenase family protein [Serratia fonticola]|uniref:phytanoyl-CoA dioxygenase family protein n=1 Tax=Serratia fonticola TaxID=47917 RepID=UPI00192BBD4F|nr:phytanoyl-CoA dioxygenase family protein [Serratia fonticola]MBL5864347.1 phytanoyl-CoA dioxygenase family protein [Serratia fonticola]